jgi:hypothetical protein
VTDGSCFWPRVCGWRMPAARCGAKTLSESWSTPRCSRRTSASQPTPSCCTPPSGASTAWPTSTGAVAALLPPYRQTRVAMMAGRYGHAKQFNRHRPQLRILRSRLGRLIRDIGRKIAGHEQIDAAFASAASSSIPSMNRRPSASARARRARPTSSGSRSSPPTPALPGGQFVLHAKALPGNPYDGHTLRDVIEDTQKLTGCEIERSYVDKGYRGHDAENPRPRLHLRTKARHLRWHQTRTATMLRHRAGDRSPKAEGHLGRCISKVVPETPPTRSSPPSATTSGVSSHG